MGGHDPALENREEDHGGGGRGGRGVERESGFGRRREMRVISSGSGT